ncbi:MAG: CxxC-x17-CxxC domain-containing protein [Patescibacteria group bacterium]
MEFPEIPKNRDITYLGLTTYRDKNTLFGIKRKDRRQHVYILGKSGTGKSVLMFNMIIQNIQNGDGVCLVDPHGENVEGVLSSIPPHRVKDVVYFNPADTEHHIGFNVLELVDPQYKHLVASGLMGIFTKIWANAWSARMEYILNNTILALLDTPGSTMLGIPRMLVDKDYRQKIISNLKDPVIKAFWVHEYEAWQDKFRNEAIAPIQNKVGQFLSTSIIRNVVGQSKSTIDIFNMMNEGKIFLVNVSKGRIGEDNSALLGGMIITKIQLAAMERVRIPEDSRRDFYLYVDEFQNFVTDAFAGILSEARKYRLNLTVAHQYTAQLVSDKSTAVRDAVFGNVGTMIIFRVGSDDAEFLEKEFDPEFTPQDIVNLPNYKIYLKLMIDGVTSRPFSSRTLPPMVKSGNKEIEEAVIKSSRELYCKSKEEIEREINNWSGMSLGGEGGESVNQPTGKFEITCSACKKQTTVPFKPEGGRPVYCKECMAKIKSGELKVQKGKDDQIKYDDSKFYKPLADLGIEYKPKDEGVKSVINSAINKELKEVKEVPKEMQKEKVVKKEEEKPPYVQKQEVSPLKQALNKITEIIKTEPAPVVEEVKETINKEEPSPELLKEKIKVIAKKSTIVTTSKDKSASKEDMKKLRDFLASAPMKQTEENTKKEIPEIQKEPEVKPSEEDVVPLPKKPKEVPEEVLRKILED